jgi:hypothetical protein
VTKPAQRLALLLLIAGCGRTKPAASVGDGAVDVKDTSTTDAKDATDVAAADATPFMGCGDDADGQFSDAATDVDGGTDCVVPEIADPTFRTATAWTTTGGAALTCGAAELDGVALCNFGGIGQTLAPIPACGRPLIASISTSFVQNDHSIQSLGVRLGDGWSFFYLPNPPRTTSVCLGANVFEDPANIFIAAGNQPQICPPDAYASTIALSRVSIDVDANDTCPPLGTIPNGDFEGGDTGWQLQDFDATAEIKAGLGDGGSAGLHITSPTLCAQGAASSAISIPTAAMVPNAALRIWSKGTAGATAILSVGLTQTTFMTELVGQDVGVTRDLCLPRWALGTVQPILLTFAQRSGICAPAPLDFVFDDLAFVSDPSCAANADVFDPGFELSLPGSTMAPFWSPSTTQAPTPTSSVVEIKADPTFAHSGTAAAFVAVSQTCGDAGLSGGVTVPQPKDGAGPALRFWYKTSALTSGIPTVEMMALPQPLTLAASPQWKQTTACLDPRLAGWPDALHFDLDTSPGDCGLAFGPDTLAIDDVELTTDASCAAR